MSNQTKQYSKLLKGIAKVDHDLRQYRVSATLINLRTEKHKADHLKKLEAQLTAELAKKLQCPLTIDALLEELEARL